MPTIGFKTGAWWCLTALCFLLAFFDNYVVEERFFCEARKSSSGGSRVPSSRGSSRSSSSSRSNRGVNRSSSTRAAPSSSGSSVSSRRRRASAVPEYEESEDEYDNGMEDFMMKAYDQNDDYDDDDENKIDIHDDVNDDLYDEEPLYAKRNAKHSKKTYRKSRKSYGEYDDYDREDEEDRYDSYSPQSSPSTSSRRSSSYKPSSGRASRGSSRNTSSRSGRNHHSSSSHRHPPSSSRMVPYAPRNRHATAPSAFTRGLAALKSSIPDAESIKEKTLSSLNAVQQSTTKLSANLYREVKGLTSSELEQVMLKATKPDDTPVKGKHVERLVGVTYQISGRYDIYDSVLRKLWSKMTERDWRTTIKALYVLHRFSADGSPGHQASLKARLRELRRTRDPKRKGKFFNNKQLLNGSDSPEFAKYQAFILKYSHYVFLRAQCFGGMFNEIAKEPESTSSTTSPSQSRSKRSSSSSIISQNNNNNNNKPITSTCLKIENLDAAKILLKAGTSCTLKKDETCENTAIALERVVSDLIGLTTAVAIALNRVLKLNNNKTNNNDLAIVQQWCEFYSIDLLPQTRAMVKKTTSTLDAFGLYLPSRMGASVSPDLLQKGLRPPSSSSEEQDDDDNGDDRSSTKDQDAKIDSMEKMGSKGMEDNMLQEEEEPIEDEFQDEQVKEDAKGMKEMEQEEDSILSASKEEDIYDTDAQEEDEEEYDVYEYDEEEYYDEED